MRHSWGSPVPCRPCWRGRPAHSFRPGFTLVEILLALGLTMIVLAAALAGMVLLQNITVAGRARAGQAQLARAIERQIRSDIRCVLFQQQETEVEGEEETQQSSSQYATTNQNVGAADDPGGTTTTATATGTTDAKNTGSTSTSSTSTSSTSSSSSSASSTSTSSTTPTGAFASQSMGVFGNATTLVLHVSKPSRQGARSLGSFMSTGATGATGPISQLSDLRSISYFLAVSGGGGLQGAVGNSASGGSAMFATAQGAQGLARLEGNRLKIQQADAAGNLNLLAQQAKILAPEVTELQFRYFNGQNWMTAWDSVTLNALPRAIEVTMRIGQPPSAEPSASPLTTTASASPSLVYRFVVSLPLSDRTLGILPAGGY